MSLYDAAAGVVNVAIDVVVIDSWFAPTCLVRVVHVVVACVWCCGCCCRWCLLWLNAEDVLLLYDTVDCGCSICMLCSL